MGCIVVARCVAMRCFPHRLGEHNIWGKHTNVSERVPSPESHASRTATCDLRTFLTDWRRGQFELGARVPLMFHAAGQTEGVKSNSLVESVDIYPTL